MPRKAPPFPDDDDDEQGDFDFFDEREFVRPTDPETAKNAARRINPTKGCIEAFTRIRPMLEKAPDGMTGMEFKVRMERELIAQGWPQIKADSKSESWRRRLTDLHNKWHWLVCHLDPETEKIRERDGRQIYFLPRNASNKLQPGEA